MKLQEAIQILETYNKWRKGAEIPQPDPVRIGMAIDVVTADYKEKKAEFPSMEVELSISANPIFEVRIRNREKLITMVGVWPPRRGGRKFYPYSGKLGIGQEVSLRSLTPKVKEGKILYTDKVFVSRGITFKEN